MSRLTRYLLGHALTFGGLLVVIYLFYPAESRWKILLVTVIIALVALPAGFFAGRMMVRKQTTQQPKD